MSEQQKLRKVTEYEDGRVRLDFSEGHAVFDSVDEAIERLKEYRSEQGLDGVIVIGQKGPDDISDIFITILEPLKDLCNANRSEAEKLKGEYVFEGV